MASKEVMKPKVKPILSACRELGVINCFLFIFSFGLILAFELMKLPGTENLSTWWVVAGVIAYTVFASYFGYFFTYLLPRSYKKEALMFYLYRRATDIAITVSFIVLELINKSGSDEPNRRDRSVDELRDICNKVDVYQKFSSHFERNEPYDDFYEFFSYNAGRINEMVEKLLAFSDVLSEHQIAILADLEKDSNSPMTRNIKFSAGTIDGKPARALVPESYAYVISQMRKNAQALLESIGIGGSVV